MELTEVHVGLKESDSFRLWIFLFEKQLLRNCETILFPTESQHLLSFVENHCHKFSAVILDILFSLRALEIHLIELVANYVIISDNLSEWAIHLLTTNLDHLRRQSRQLTSISVSESCIS